MSVTQKVLWSAVCYPNGNAFVLPQFENEIEARFRARHNLPHSVRIFPCETRHDAFVRATSHLQAGFDFYETALRRLGCDLQDDHMVEAQLEELRKKGSRGKNEI